MCICVEEILKVLVGGMWIGIFYGLFYCILCVYYCEVNLFESF